MKEYLDWWQENRPVSFDPIWLDVGDGKAFPKIWFANDYHGTNLHPNSSHFYHADRAYVHSRWSAVR